MFGSIRFLWRATRGYRLRPWRSPYIRWRMETFSGIGVQQLSLRTILRIVVRNRRQFLQFLRWTTELRQIRLHGARKRG